MTRWSLLLLLVCGLAAVEHLAEADALRQAFPTADRFTRETVQATPEQIRTVLTSARSTARGQQGPMYTAWHGGNWIGTIHIDQAIGRTEFITWMCAIGRDDRIRLVRVLTYREAIGGEVAGGAWLDRFTGLSARDRLRRGRPIPNLGGATMSVDALTERCRLLLDWHTLVVAPILSARYSGTSPATAGDHGLQRAIPVGDAALTVRLAGPDAARLAPALFARATTAAREAELVINQWRPDSEAARLNGQGGGTPSPALAGVLDAIARWHGPGAGAFDPTIAPVVAAWAAADGGDCAPEPAAWQTRIGWPRVGWDGRHLALPPGMALDYGGLAKGWIVDRVATALATHTGDGCVDIHLDHGGSSQACLGATPTRIALADPRDPAATLQIITLPPGRGFGATRSAGRTVTIGGVIYGHLFDPRTARPLPRDRAAFVIAPSALLADLLDTAVCVLDAPQALALAQQAGAEVLRWDGAGFQATPGWPGGIPR